MNQLLVLFGITLASISAAIAGEPPATGEAPPGVSGPPDCKWSRRGKIGEATVAWTRFRSEGVSIWSEDCRTDRGAVREWSTEDAEKREGSDWLYIKSVVPGKYDGETILARFDFSGGKPGVNPPIVSADGSIVAVTNYPATQTAMTHVFLRYPNGDLLALNSFQPRVAAMLEEPWRNAAEHDLTAVSIEGRMLRVAASRKFPRRGVHRDFHRFNVRIGQHGELKVLPYDGEPYERETKE